MLDAESLYQILWLLIGIATLLFFAVVARYDFNKKKSKPKSRVEKSNFNPYKKYRRNYYD